MSCYYFDSSALAKKYINEAGSDWVLNITATVSRNQLITSLITSVEVVAAIAKGGRMGALSDDDMHEAILAFKKELHQNVYSTLAVTQQIVDKAMNLAEEHGLRAYDSVQLSSALELQSERELEGLSPVDFVSCDLKLNAAAESEGLNVINPQTLHKPDLPEPKRQNDS